MTGNSDGDSRSLPAHAPLPVAKEGDTLTTAALEPSESKCVTALHVIEKGEGVLEKTPVEQSEGLAEELSAAVRSVFFDADEHTAYARDIVAAILEAADEVGTSALAYRSRGGDRSMQFLSGDLSRKLIPNVDRPVITLSRVDSNE